MNDHPEREDERGRDEDEEDHREHVVLTEGVH